MTTTTDMDNGQNNNKSGNYATVIAALSSVPFIMVLGNSMLIPVLPEIKSTLHLTQIQVSMIITAFSLPGLLIPLAGFLSDRIGRKKIIIPGLILYGLGGIIAGTAAFFLQGQSYTWILVGRIVQGIGAAGTTPIAMALTGDIFSGAARSKALGVVEASNGLGKVISPVLGAALGLIAWYTAFLFFPVIIIPIVLGVGFLIKEPQGNLATQNVSKYLQSVRLVFQKKSALLLTSFFAGMAALLILFGILFFLSDFLETKLGLTSIVKGLALAVPVLFMSTTSYVTGLYLKNKVHWMKWLAVAGLAMISGSLAALGLFQNIYFFFTAISLIGIGTGLLLPCLNTIITSAVEPKKRGLVTSVYGGVRFLGVAAGPPLFGLSMDLGRAYMYWGGAGLAGIAALGALLFIRVTDLKQPAPAHAANEQTPGLSQIRAEFIFAPARKPLPNKKNPN